MVYTLYIERERVKKIRSALQLITNIDHSIDMPFSELRQEL